MEHTRKNIFFGRRSKGVTEKQCTPSSWISGVQESCKKIQLRTIKFWTRYHLNFEKRAKTVLRLKGVRNQVYFMFLRSTAVQSTTSSSSENTQYRARLHLRYGSVKVVKRSSFYWVHFQIGGCINATCPNSSDVRRYFKWVRTKNIFTRLIPQSGVSRNSACIIGSMMMFHHQMRRVSYTIHLW